MYYIHSEKVNLQETFTAFADAWPRTIETEIGAALCAIGRGKGLL